MVLGLPLPPGMVDTIIRLTALVVLTLAALSLMIDSHAIERLLTDPHRQHLNN